ncbi:MAG: RluA family pseudouridine synthase [Leptospira sp.]|nr:RluA family pseudouridine synthase [Leptospira sp.]
MKDKEEILFENEFFLLANKPEGIPVHETKDPNRPDFTRYLINKYGYMELRTANRLDLGTSGIVVFGKDNSINKELDEALKNSIKEYLFLAIGIPDWKEIRHECFLKDGNKKVTVVRSGGKKAITDFTMLEYDVSKNIFLGQANLITGRRHQIRIALASSGFPILGDIVYGNKIEKFTRMFLHAYHITLVWRGEKVDIKCPLPETFHHIFPSSRLYI